IFLGWTLNTVHMTFSLPEPRRESILRAVKSRLEDGSASHQDLQHLCGLLNSTRLAIFPGPLYCRGLQRLLRSSRLPWSRRSSPLSVETVRELQWWITTLS